MGIKLLASPTAQRYNREEYAIFDDFVSFTDAQLWTVAVVATGTAAHAGSVGTSDFRLFGTAANDAAVIATTHEVFEFLADKALVYEARVKSADVDTDDGMWGFGFADALAATTLADSTGAVTATDAAMIVKLPDSTVYTFHTEVNGTATTSTSVTTRDTSNYQTLRIELIPATAAGVDILEARPFVDGEQLKTSAGVPIMHRITPLTTTTELDMGGILKTNDAADLVVLVDYIYAAQLRT
jgi:hypothetical protein